MLRYKNIYMEKANLTLYTVIGKPERIPDAIQKFFAAVAKEAVVAEGQTVLTLQDDTEITFNISHRRDRQEFIASHTEGMANYFLQAETENEELKTNVIRQIQCFNCVTGIVFEIDENEERTNYIINTLFDLAAEINGFLLYPNMSLFNGKRQLVFSIQGESELESFAPVANADLLDEGRPEDTEADLARQERSMARLKAEDIPYLPHLRSEVNEQEAHIKSREEIVQRAVALFAVAVYSEVMLSENPDRDEALGYVGKLDEIYGAGQWLTPKESAYLANPSPDQHECIQFVWRYECCGALLWAAGITDDLPYPSEICDVPIIAQLFWQQKSIADLLSKGYARPDAELLDAADLTLRYDWACVDARIHGKEAPAKLDGGIVMERHYALNWVIGANGGAPWDEIQPTT